jgi:hypothetical protein
MMVEPWEKDKRPVRRTVRVTDGTLIRFRNWPDKLGLELAGQLGKVYSGYQSGEDWVYHIDVGPGWGYTSHVFRHEFVKVGTL